MPERVRLDSELVRRGLARSRRHAGELITGGRVRVDGAAATKVAMALGPEQAVEVDVVDGDGFASRGAYKLAGALDALGAGGPAVTGRRCLDAGASTGGFTDVLLRRGAQHVVAVDVGHGQLVPWLRDDPRVTVREGVNVRHLAAGDVGPAPELVVADLSFISLTLVLPALSAVVVPGGDLVLMVKPQFEVGRERLGAGGVVRDPALRAEAVLAVARAAAAVGARPQAVVASPLPGPHGNVEYFLWARAAAAGDDAGVGGTGQDVTERDALTTGRLRALVDEAVRTGPTGGGSTWTSGGGR
ncbi:TlyA family RNA methyltransferase [uncultured Cellulomonas sp.]|uniref:TlyA family RNA methyltransferase n=1 Tax=uncultured Cellulomonas sp. TaxID=189682 RepID=UPI00263A11F4|nr:TlyA family RNA methyltransferase [uncultured Cellulomonas sp.]